MLFNNATLLSLNKTSEFQSDTFRYKSTKNLTVEGLLLDLSNDNGVKNIVDNIKSFQQSLINDWQDIIINGVNFAPNSRGIITSIKFDEGNDVRLKKYTVEITIPEDGDSSTLTSSTNYTGLNFSKFLFVKSFSESIDYTQSTSLDTYNQTVSITLNTPPSQNSIDEAKTIAENFFNNNTLTNTVGHQSTYSNTKKFYTESYDSVSFECSFSKNFELYKGSNGLFSSSRTHKINFDDQGIMSITESAEYVSNTTSFSTANNQAIIDINNAFTDRCGPIFNTYYKTTSDDTLCSTPVSKSWNSNVFANTVSYEITFSNQLRMGKTFTAYHDYSTTLTETEAGVYSFSYEGSVIGFGEFGSSNIKYANASNSFQTIKSSLLVTPTSPVGLKEVSRSETHSEIAGKIDYSRQYSTADNLLNPQLNGIRRINTVISKDYNRFLSSNFNIIGYKEIVQIQQNKLENTINYNITMNGKADTDISTYVTKAKSIMTSYPPPSPAYVSDVNYSYDPFGRQFTFNLSYFSLPS